MKSVLLVLGLSLIFMSGLPAEASSLKYHRAILEQETGTDRARNTFRSRARDSIRRPQVVRLDDRSNIRARILERLQRLRAAKSSKNENLIAQSTRFTADRVDFHITAPADFTKTVDTLLPDSGQFVLRRNEDRITIAPTGDICEGGNAAFFACFRAYWEVQQRELLNQYNGAVVIENNDFRWRDEIVAQQLSPDNTGRYLLIEQGDLRVAQFLFEVPRWDNLWEVRVLGTRNDSILSNSNGAKRILQTMFSTQPIRGTQRVSQQRIDRTRLLNRRTNAGPRIGRTLFSKKDVTVVRADGISFQIEPPKSYQKVNDSLVIDGGELLIEDSLSPARIRISGTGDQCNSQTLSIIQRCTQPLHDNFLKKFTTDNANLRLIQTRAYGLRLTPNQDFRSDFAVLSLLRSTVSAERFGLLTWREPNVGQVWRAIISAPEDETSILSNQQKLNAMITSILYP